MKERVPTVRENNQEGGESAPYLAFNERFKKFKEIDDQIENIDFGSEGLKVLRSPLSVEFITEKQNPNTGEFFTEEIREEAVFISNQEKVASNWGHSQYRLVNDLIVAEDSILNSEEVKDKKRVFIEYSHNEYLINKNDFLLENDINKEGEETNTFKSNLIKEIKESSVPLYDGKYKPIKNEIIQDTLNKMGIECRFDWQPPKAKEYKIFGAGLSKVEARQILRRHLNFESFLGSIFKERVNLNRFEEYSPGKGDFNDGEFNWCNEGDDNCFKMLMNNNVEESRPMICLELIRNNIYELTNRQNQNNPEEQKKGFLNIFTNISEREGRPWSKLIEPNLKNENFKESLRLVIAPVVETIIEELIKEENYDVLKKLKKIGFSLEKYRGSLEQIRDSKIDSENKRFDELFPS